MKLKLTLEEWSKMINKKFFTGFYGLSFYSTLYNDGSIDKHMNDGSVEHIDSPLTPEEIQRRYQEDIGQSW